MQQTFYIENDEEISSVIERLRKSIANRNFFVLPKRALVMQSVVNLKLLKREAEKMHKQIIIVTQDELSGNIARRAGITVYDALENIEDGSGKDDISQKIRVFAASDADDSFAGENGEPEHELDRKKRLKTLGSENFFGVSGEGHAIKQETTRTEKVQRKNLTEKISAARRMAGSDISAGSKIGENLPTRISVTAESKAHLQTEKLRTSANGYVQKLDPQKEKKLESLFQEKNVTEKSAKVGEISIKGRTKKIVTLFALSCVLAFAGIAAYLFVPKAKVLVTLSPKQQKIDVGVNGNEKQTATDWKNKELPVRFLQERQSVTLSYEATGKGAGNGSKAHGVVEIYNEFSAEPQVLVATTRLETAEGKIFRITKNVTVPGMTSAGGEIKPGTVEVEVLADQTGEEYNIDAAEFKIPGFKDSPKYEKFKGKSNSTMTGGSLKGDGPKLTTLQDLENAKRDAETKFKEKSKELLKNELGQDEVLKDEALQFALTQSIANVKAGNEVTTFDYTVTGDVSAAIFSAADAKQILREVYLQNAPIAEEIENIKVDYAAITPDFEKKTLFLKLYGEIEFKTNIDAQKLKDELLGKDEDGALQVVRKYPEIKNVVFEFEPKFISRVPQYSRRVDLEFVTEK